MTTPEPSMARELLEAARAGVRAGWDSRQFRSDNPHGALEEPGSLAKARYWLSGFNKGREQRRHVLSRGVPTF